MLFFPTWFLIEEREKHDYHGLFLSFEHDFFFFWNLEEASIGWVSHNHRPSTQWIIIYRLVVFLTPPFITSFWASSIVLDFRLWMIILIALASGEIGDLTIFGLRWSIWKPCCCAKTVPDTQPDQSGVELSDWQYISRRSESPQLRAKERKTISSLWLDIEQKILQPRYL